MFQIEIPKIDDVLVGQFRVLQVFGGGGQGNVFKCRSLADSSLRAVKMIRPDAASGAVTRESTRRHLIAEANTLKQLSHPGMPRYYDTLVDTHGNLLLVTDFVEGPTLEERLQEGPLSEREVLQLLDVVAATLAAVHANQIQHLDISPDNIILAGGNVRDAKLIDFGIATGLPGDGKTIVCSFRGKVNYAAPEQFSGVGCGASDIYSLGLVLAEAASGTQILDARTLPEAAAQRRKAVNLPASIPPALRRKLLPMLSVSPEQRPTAQSLRASGNSSEPGPPKRSDGLRPAVVALYLLAALVAGIAAGLWWFQWSPEFERVAPEVRSATVPPALAPRWSIPRATAGAKVTRAQIISAADRLARYSWAVPDTAGAACGPSAPALEWGPREPVTGVPYSWGGTDDAGDFGKKLQFGFRPGSHSTDGLGGCATGIDCSGLILRVWKVEDGNRYTTRTLHLISQAVDLNPFTDLLPGDALNKPGRHVVLFAGYGPNGGPIVYEALGRAGRVVRDDTSTWSRYQGYHPIRYRDVAD